MHSRIRRLLAHRLDTPIPVYGLAAAALTATLLLTPAHAAPHQAAATTPAPAAAVQVDDTVPHRAVAAVAYTHPATTQAPQPQRHRPVVTTTAGAKRYARSLLSQRQYACLDHIYERESGWNIHAWNPEGAYGIPQAFPGWKMRTFGSDWRWNAATQINWGLHYIHSRYGTPCGAWAFWQGHNWY